MIVIYFTSLAALLLRTSTTDTFYTIIPDDHPYTRCHHCHNLQHYLLNTTKYFTSNTQLLFLPGLHHLHTNVIIQNVQNISLIGNCTTNEPNETPDVTVRCKRHNRGIVFVNVTNLTITGMVIKDCMSYYNHDVISQVYAHEGERAALMIINCTDVVLHWLCVHTFEGSWLPITTSIMTANILGNSLFSYISCYGMINIIYNDTNNILYSTYLIIKHYYQHHNELLYSLLVEIYQTSYLVSLHLSNIDIVKNECEGCQFRFSIDASIINLTSVVLENCNFSWNGKGRAMLHFTNSRLWCLGSKFLSNNVVEGLIIMINSVGRFSDCIFFNNSDTKALQVKFGMVRLNNVYFSHNNDNKDLLDLSNATLRLENKVVFKGNKVSNSLIALKSSSRIKVLDNGSIRFLENKVLNIISFGENGGGEFVHLTEGCCITFSKNQVCAIFGISPPSYPFCVFQYYGTTKQYQQHRNYSIVFSNNKYTDSKPCNRYMPIADCRWLPDSLFTNIPPVDVNEQYITYHVNDVNTNHSDGMSHRHKICLCTGRSHPDCNINELGHFYPGQTVQLYIYYKSNSYRQNKMRVKITYEFDINQLYITPCMVSSSELLQTVEGSICTGINYTLGYTTNSRCGLFLKAALESDDHIRLFYVGQLPCPFGFVKSNNKCVCHPKLAHFGIIKCNINDQTLLRPANSWISGRLHNGSYIYQVSLACPFYYCLPYSSYLNLSTLNSRCQFNRSGILCGQCQQGLSSMFASSKCQKCSNVNLLLIIPIAVAGLLLVLMLFILNLTVTDGAINACVLYVNITSINSSELFQAVKPVYPFISLANLDLGIQTCFYNGMNDYAKMWLQLAFPFYLIFIATSLIITSRYSTSIQRLTARRALPVLATLFLLSYTKILQTVSSVMFSYSIITQLPSEQSTIVWSVDANVPLLGVRFVLLFISSLIVFLIQVPFTITLLFSRPLRRFHYINKFKPLLDAYQGPYKDDHYYWTGIQLLVRAVFLGISTLEKGTNLLISTITIGLMCVATGIAHPFKSKLHNYHELILLLNLQILHIVMLNNSNVTIIIIVITMAIVHFTLIMINNIISNLCGRVNWNKIQKTVSSAMEWFSCKPTTVQHFQLDNVPEVTFNYCEYQEPLVALD